MDNGAKWCMVMDADAGCWAMDDVWWMMMDNDDNK